MKTCVHNLSIGFSVDEFQIIHSLAGCQGVVNFRAGAAADITAHIDDKDLIGHVNFPLVHVIQHLLGTFGPHLIVAGMAEEPGADDNIPFLSQFFLCLRKSVLEPGVPVISVAQKHNPPELSSFRTTLN